MRTIIFGKTHLACRVACWLHAEGELIGVVPVRSEPTWAPSLRDWAALHRVPVLTHEEACAGRPPLCLSILYDRLFGEELDHLPRVVNFHPGPLPAYRGCNPVNWALKNGERSHGVTLHEINSGIDTGPILAEATFPVYPGDEVRDLYFRSLRYGEVLLEDTLPRLGTLRGTPQTSRGRLYTVADRGKLGDRGGWTQAESRRA